MSFFSVVFIFFSSVSKQQAIVPGQCYQLEDNTSSFKDFHGSRNNRFTSPEQAAKNRIQHPSNVLHFFNAQPDISVEMFNQVWRPQLSIQVYGFPTYRHFRLTSTVVCTFQVCEDLGIKGPTSVKLFTGKSE